MLASQEFEGGGVLIVAVVVAVARSKLGGTFFSCSQGGGWVKEREKFSFLLLLSARFLFGQKFKDVLSGRRHSRPPAPPPHSSSEGKEGRVEIGKCIILTVGVGAVRDNFPSLGSLTKNDDDLQVRPI